MTGGKSYKSHMLGAVSAIAFAAFVATPVGAWVENTAADAAPIPTAPPAPKPVPKLNSSTRTIVIAAPLKERDAYLGDVEIQVAPDDSVAVSAEQVLPLLAKTVDPAALAVLKPFATPGNFVPLAQFAAVGMPITFDPSTLELNIQVSATARGRRSIGLADLDREVYGEFAKPEPFSAYMNFRGALDYVHESAGQTGLGDPIVLLDGAVRFAGLVLESEGAWDGGDDGGFNREGTRLVWDDIEHLNRWTAGDLQPQSRGFQGQQDIAGFGVTRSYSLLDPQRNVTPRGGRTFTIERDATVEAFINGRSVRTIRLQPGTYDVNDFPFVQGSNDVDLVIVDDAGQREVVSFSLFIDRTQLARGLSEYGFYTGVLTGLDGRDDVAASGFYRRGVTDSLTLGGNAQATPNAALVGAEAVWGSPLGTIGGDVAVSNMDAAGSGWAVNVSYERLIESPTGGLSFLATFEARSRRFGPPSFAVPDNAYPINASVSVNKSFGETSFAGVQIRYAKARDGFEDDQSVRFTYGRRLSQQLNMIIDVDWAAGGFNEGTGFRIALIRRFGETGSARAEYDSRAERGRVGYQTSGGRGVGAWSATADLDVDENNYGLNAGASYIANRAELGIAHNSSYSPTSSTITDQRSSVRMASGIAFAGGKFAVGQPISDGFAIIHPYAGAPKVRIEVEPSQDGYYANSSAFGPALYGQISAYSPRTVIFDAPSAPPGFDVGQGALRVLAPYRAGYVIAVGSDYGVTAVGRLLNAEGQPVALLAGVAIEQGGERRKIDLFTNRQGTFGASGLKAGRWQVELPGNPPLRYDLVVPETKDGIARVGDLRPVQ